jgi:hypothetical protein
VNEKTPLEILDEVEEFLKKKKQARYFSIAGFSFLLIHAFTHILIFLVIAIALLCAAILRHIQVRAFANKKSKENDVSATEPDQRDSEVKPTHTFEPNNIVSSVPLQFGSTVYELSFQYEKEDWEGSDILLCKSHDREVNIHPATFLKYLESTDCNYLHNQGKSFIESLKHTPCLKFGYLEDSRDYPSITVEGAEVVIMCKYLCPIFYSFSKEEDVILIVDGLRDENGEEIPAVITDVKEYIFLESTAEFSVEEDVWIQI